MRAREMKCDYIAIPRLCTLRGYCYLPYCQRLEPQGRGSFIDERSYIDYKCNYVMSSA